MDVFFFFLVGERKGNFSQFLSITKLEDVPKKQAEQPNIVYYITIEYGLDSIYMLPT